MFALVAVGVTVAAVGLLTPAFGDTPTAWIASPEEGSIVYGVTEVRVEHRCPDEVQSARLLVTNTLGNESFLVLPVSLDPVTFAWDTARTRVGTTILRVRLMGCVGPGLETMTERVSVLAAFSPRTSTTTTSTTSTTTTSTTTTTTAPVSSGPVAVTLEVWVANPHPFGDRADQLHARCQVRVPAGSSVGVTLDEAQRSGCIRIWAPHPGTRDYVLCLDGMCSSLGQEIGAGPQTYWSQPSSVQLDDGDVVRLRYEVQEGPVLSDVRVLVTSPKAPSARGASATAAAPVQAFAPAASKVRECSWCDV